MTITKEEFKKFIRGSNQDAPTQNEGYYLKYFDHYEKGKKLSWNWSSFFAPFIPWFIYRKMYLVGLSMNFLTANTLVFARFLSLNTNHPEFYELPIGICFMVLLCVLFGFSGNQMYVEHSIKKIKRNKFNGGTNKWLFILMLFFNVLINLMML